MTFVVRKTATRPTAVVFLLGWHGAQMRHLQKYAELYDGKNCATISGVCHPLSIMTKWDSAIDRFVMQGIRKAYQIFDDYDEVNEIPVIVHCFSNGGGFCLQRLRIIIEQQQQKKKDTSEMKIAAEIFDSAPAFVTFDAGTKAMYRAAPNLFVFALIFAAGFTIYLIDYLVAHICRRDPSSIAYWKDMKEGPNVCPQAFVYSTADDVSDYNKLDELVEFRRSHLKGDITVLKVTDTGHVQHLRSHRKAYEELIRSILSKVAH